MKHVFGIVSGNAILKGKSIGCRKNSSCFLSPELFKIGSPISLQIQPLIFSKDSVSKNHRKKEDRMPTILCATSSRTLLLLPKRLIAITVVVCMAHFSGLACRSLYAADSIQTAGDVLLFVLPATAAGLTLGHCDAKGALQLGESLGVTLGVTYALKYGINETRPNGEGQSFPSAHTSVSFSSAEFIRKRYGWIYGGPAYALATFVAYSRVESRQHYIHDVAAAAAIGILSSYIFTKPYKGVDVRLETDGKYYGLNFNLKW